MLCQMKELPLAERVERITQAATRDSAPVISETDRGEAIIRACLGARQILDARPDGERLRLQQEPAPAYRAIWPRLNSRWREASGR